MSVINYRQEIDGLRALAILPVIVHHSGFHFLPGGFLGVDVFFVISGYLITLILMKEIDAHSFTFSSFYKRRAKRILPALFFMLFITCILSLFVLDPKSIQSYGQSLVAVTTFAANIYFYFKADYFNPVSELNPLLHMWSLAVEEQFYIFFPVMLLIAVRCRFNLLMLFSALFLLSFLSMMLNSSAESLNFYMLHTRAWELAAGSIAAWFTRNGVFSHVGKVPRNLVVTFSIIAMILGYVLYNPSYGFPGWYTLVPVLSSFLFIIFANGKDLPSKILTFQPIVYVGLISYSLYLWHQPIFSFMKIITLGESTINLQLAAIALTFLLSTVSYIYVETPVRKSKQSHFVVFKSSLLGSIAFICLAVGFSQYTKIFQIPTVVKTAVTPSRGLSADCDYDGPYSDVDTCSSGDKPSVLVWGDSYAMHLVHGLAKKMPLKQATKNACSPNIFMSTLPKVKGYDESWAKECLKFNQQVFESIKADSSIKTIVLSSTFEQWLQYAYWNGDKEIANSFQAYKQSFKATLKEISTLNRQVIVITPPPKNGRDIGQCLIRSELALPTFSEFNSKGCTFTLDELSEQNAQIMSFLNEMDGLYGIKVLSLASYLCQKGRCTTYSSYPLYLDAGHLNDYGSEYVADFIRNGISKQKHSL